VIASLPRAVAPLVRRSVRSADGRGGDEREKELAGAFAADVSQTPHVDHSDRDREYDGGQHATRQVLKRSGQEQQHEQHDALQHQLRDLAARAT
jgi:hypothetical protein